MRKLSKAAKALILTWIMIGLLVAGGIGFYLGRITVPKPIDQNLIQMQSRNGLKDDQQTIGNQQPLQDRPLPSGFRREGSDLKQGGQQNPPTENREPVQ